MKSRRARVTSALAAIALCVGASVLVLTVIDPAPASKPTPVVSTQVQQAESVAGNYMLGYSAGWYAEQDGSGYQFDPNKVQQTQFGQGFEDGYAEAGLPMGS